MSIRSAKNFLQSKVQTTKNINTTPRNSSPLHSNSNNSNKQAKDYPYEEKQDNYLQKYFHSKHHLINQNLNHNNMTTGHIKNNLQQEYLTLKSKLKTVSQQNQHILKKIKHNMVNLYQSQEDSFNNFREASQDETLIDQLNINIINGNRSPHMRHSFSQNYGNFSSDNDLQQMKLTMPLQKTYITSDNQNQHQESNQNYALMSQETSSYAQSSSYYTQKHFSHPIPYPKDKKNSFSSAQYQQQPQAVNQSEASSTYYLPIIAKSNNHQQINLTPKKSTPNSNALIVNNSNCSTNMKKSFTQTNQIQSQNINIINNGNQLKIKNLVLAQFQTFQKETQNNINKMTKQFTFLELKYNNLVKSINQLKNISIQNKQSFKQKQLMGNAKKRQNQMLIQEYLLKINKLINENQLLQQKNANYQLIIQQKNNSIIQIENQLRNVNKKYNQIVQQVNIEKMKLSKKVFQITADKNTKIENLQRKIDTLNMTASLHSSQFVSSASSVSNQQQNQFKKEIQKLKQELNGKILDFQCLKRQNKAFKEQKDNLTQNLQKKNQELNKISLYLKQNQLNSIKNKQMYEQLQNQLKDLASKKLKKQSQYNEQINKIKEQSRKKILELNQKISSLKIIINSLVGKLPKKLRKTLQLSLEIQQQQILAIICKFLSQNQQKQTKLLNLLKEKFHFSSIEMQVEGIQTLLEKIRLQIQSKNKKILELDENYHQLQLKSLKSRRQVSPINSMKKSYNFSSPRNDNSSYVNSSQQQLSQKKKEIFQLKQQLIKKQNQVKFHVKKMEILSSQKDEILQRFQNQRNQYKKLFEQKQSALRQVQLLQKQQRQDTNKSSSTKIFLEMKCQKLSEKNSQISKENDKLQKKIEQLEIKAKNEINMSLKLKAEFKQRQKLLKQESTERKNIISNLNQQKNKLIGQIKILQGKLQAQNSINTNEQNQKIEQKILKNSYQYQMSSLKTTLQHKQKLIKDYQHKNHLMSKKKDEIENDLKASQSINKLLQNKKGIQLDQLKKQISKLKIQKQDIQKRSNEQISRLQKQITKFNEQKTHKMKQYQVLSKSNKDIKNKIKQQKQISQHRKQQIQHNKSQIKILQGKLNQANIVNNQLLRINSSLQQQINNQKEQFQMRIKCLQRQILTIKGQLKKQENKYSQIKNNFLNKEDQFNQLKLKYQLLQNSIKQQANQKSIIKGKTMQNQKKLLKNIQNLEIQKLSLKNQLQSKKRQIIQKNDQLIKIKLHVDQKQKEILSLIQKNNDLKYSLMDDLDNKSQYIRQIRTQYTQEVQFLQEKNVFIQRQNFELKQKNQKLQQKCNQLLKLYNDLNIKLQNFDNLLSESKLDLRQKEKEIINAVRKFQENQQKVIRLENQCSLLKNKYQQLQNEIACQRQTNVQFIKDMDVEHRQQTQMLSKKIKKNDSTLKQIANKLSEYQSLIQQKDLEYQILVQKFNTQKKWKQQALQKLQQKQKTYEISSHLIENIGKIECKQCYQRKYSFNNEGQIDLGRIQSCAQSTNSLSTKTNTKIQKKQLINRIYISMLKSQILSIISKQKSEFSKEFISLHDSQAAYQLSLFKSQIIKKNTLPSFLEQLQLADEKNGLDLVSRFEDQLDQVVAKLQQNNNRNNQNNYQIQNLKATIKAYQQKVQKNNIQQQKIINFYLKEIKELSSRGDKLDDALVRLQKQLERIIQVTISQQPKMVQLKQAFQKIDQIYEQNRGGSVIDFQKYKETYLNRAKQYQRSKSKKKWLF